MEQWMSWQTGQVRVGMCWMSRGSRLFIRDGFSDLVTELETAALDGPAPFPAFAKRAGLWDRLSRQGNVVP
jgi:hypothetical protein